MSTERSIVMLTADRKIDRRILQQADSLEASGWMVKIIAMPSDKDHIDNDFRIMRIAQQVNLKENSYLKFYHWIRNILPKNNKIIFRLKQLLWRYMINQKTFYEKHFENIMSNFTATVFVAHDLPMLSIAAKAAQKTQAKLVYDSHELFCEQNLSRYEKALWKKIEARYIHDCDLVITVNEPIARILEKTYSIKDVKVITNAERRVRCIQEINLFHDKFHLDPNKIILLFQGNFVEKRNLENLILAMKWVTNPNVVLVMLGEGNLQPILEKMVKTNNLSQRCFFHPRVEQNVLLDYTSSADAGIIPYLAVCLNHLYCTPNKLYEFIAAGIPILANNLPEIKKIVEKNDIGRVGEMSSTSALATQINDFFKDKEKLQYWRNRTIKTGSFICWENEGKKLTAWFDGFK